MSSFYHFKLFIIQVFQFLIQYCNLKAVKYHNYCKNSENTSVSVPFEEASNFCLWVTFLKGQYSIRPTSFDFLKDVEYYVQMSVMRLYTHSISPRISNTIVDVITEAMKVIEGGVHRDFLVWPTLTLDQPRYHVSDAYKAAWEPVKISISTDPVLPFPQC